ncbi:MAG: E3 binding domain-containing protein [Rhizobiaceae bacterium]|nr:E3 binding domain-containing protein [Rhizobiaceae bacterium]
MSALPAPAVTARPRATPYARRLARERGIALSAVNGSGPGGRIVALDVEGWLAPAQAAVSTALERTAAALPGPNTMPSTPSALSMQVDFSAVEALLARIAEVRPAVDRMDVVLKAAGLALTALAQSQPDAVLLIGALAEPQCIAGLSTASLGAIATMRARSSEASDAALAVSFIGRRGLRPVATRLVGEASARLVIGGADGAGTAECLLSYDPDRMSDEDAETLLATFAELVETPLRLLV